MKYTSTAEIVHAYSLDTVNNAHGQIGCVCYFRNGVFYAKDAFANKGRKPLHNLGYEGIGCYVVEWSESDARHYITGN